MFKGTMERPCFVLALSAACLLQVSVGVGLGQEAIIIDHTCTDLSGIPPYWLEQAKLLTFHYAHTSHGSQITAGSQILEVLDPKYSVAIRVSSTEGLPPLEDPPALRIYDGNPPETYIEPGDYWDGTSGQDRTRAVADTGQYNFSMWSWCGQQSYNTYETTQRYLDTMAQFEVEYPSMRFIYMTGHTDGTGEAGTLHQRNNQVRNYCLANGKVLFDFGDIESYDPDGNYYLDLGCNDNCDYWIVGVQHNWADEWCAAHPGDDLCVYCSCAHSKPLNCNRKARAFWWMMARLAGWSGGASLVSAEPSADGTLPKTQNNVILLTFDDSISLPAGRALNIVPLAGGLEKGNAFSYSVEPDGVTLKAAEEGTILAARTWYRVTPAEGFAVEPFALDVCTLVGDANNSSRVTTADYSEVKAHMSEHTDARYDLNGNGRVTTAEYSVVKDHMGGRTPPKP